MRIMRLESAEANLLDQRLGTAPPGLGVDAANLEGHFHILHQGAPREQVVFLRDVSDLRVDPADGLPAKEDPPGARSVEPDDQVEERGLPASRGPDDRDELPVFDSDRDAVERDHPVAPNLKLFADPVD
jgi:hypothetical protein